MKNIFRFTKLYAFLLFLFLVFLTAFIFLGFWLNITINHWTLVSAFTLYVTLAFFLRKPLHIRVAEVLGFMLASSLIFLLGTNLFANTYDLSYDGAFYHEPAILALSDGWNPVRQPVIPIHTPQRTSTDLAEGSPKAVWAIDASIYRLTGKINTATMINIVIAIVALLFAYEIYLNLGLSSRASASLSLLTAMTPTLVNQFFSFREDAFSYSCLVIGISSLINLKRKGTGPVYFACLLGALLLIAGAKFSNLYVFLPLLFLSIYFAIRLKLYRSVQIRFLTMIFVLIGALVTFNPLVTNMTTFHAIDYPYNQRAYYNSLRETGVPANIRNDSNLELFFYGVFSAGNINRDNNHADYARLKIPFTFTPQELVTDATATAKLVGGYGLLFSGIFILSIAFYLYLLLAKRQNSDKEILVWLTLSIALLLISCILIPIPNYARYNSQLFLLPIVIIIGLNVGSTRTRVANKYFSWILIVLLSLNFLWDASPSFSVEEFGFRSINNQLNDLAKTHETYGVYTDTFYSSYFELHSHGIPVRISDRPLPCSNLIHLKFPEETTLCPLGRYALTDKNAYRQLL